MIEKTTADVFGRKLGPVEAARSFGILFQATKLHTVASLTTEKFWGSVVKCNDAAFKYSLEAPTVVIGELEISSVPSAEDEATVNQWCSIRPTGSSRLASRMHAGWSMRQARPIARTGACFQVRRRAPVAGGGLSTSPGNR